MKKLLFVLLMICSSINLIAEQQLNTEEENELIKELASLDWLSTGTHKLPNSHSSLSVPAGHLAVIGGDAKKLSSIFGNHTDNYLEAITTNDSFTQIVYFCNHNCGYVSVNDWSEMDPKALIESFSDNTEKANEERRQKGGAELHVVRWPQEPTLDRTTNTVYWSVELKEDDFVDHIFNSIALRLGREGFERIVWVGNISDYKPFGGELDVMLRVHSFDQGFRHCDYTTGDKIATYGAAALVASTIGAKIVKAGGLAILLKKLGGFIAAGTALFFGGIRKLLRRKDDGEFNG